MNNREEAYIAFCKSHDGNWSARDLFNGGYQAALASQAQQEPNKDVHEAIILLYAVFDAWENGTDCYDDFDGVSGSFIGKAFNLDDEIFKRCCDLLNRVNPPRNLSQAQQTESQWSVAQKISNLHSVYEALKGFAEDSTGDNGTIIVCEVIHAFKEHLKCEK